MDRGATWTRLTSPLLAERNFGLDIATSPTAPKTVYLLSGTDRKIWKSLDGGDSWTEITNNFPNDMPAPPVEGFNWNQTSYDCYITCSTQFGHDVLYVGLVDLVASTDGGSTWQSVGKTYYDDSLMHNDQHCLVVNPTDPNEMLVGNDGGIYRVTRDASATESWRFDTTLNATLGLTQFYEAAYHPTDPSRMLGGAQDNATPASLGTAAGTPIPFATWSNVGGGDGGYSAINSSNPRVQYATAQGLMIHRTGNNWGSDSDGNPASTFISYRTKVIVDGAAKDLYWRGDDVSFIAPITLDPNNPNVLYAGTNYLWRWNDSSFDPLNTNKSWTGHLGNQVLATGDNPFITHIAIAPSDSNRIYTGSGSGEIWMSTDAGASWLQLNSGSPEIPRYWVTSIAVDPTNPNKILVGLSGTSSPSSQHPGHLWQCANTMAANRSWKNLSGGLSGNLPDIPLNSVVIDPSNASRVYYVGTDVGVFITKDGGATWANITSNLGLPNVQVNHLEIVPGTGYLMAATFGRGIWRLRLPANVGPGNLIFHAQSNSFNLNMMNMLIKATEAARKTIAIH
jgi:photosystem II stability/assembly factor-like uncharacterized protein